MTDGIGLLARAFCAVWSSRHNGACGLTEGSKKPAHGPRAEEACLAGVEW